AARICRTYAHQTAQKGKIMIDYDDLYGSRFLAATDVKNPVTATIERIDQEQFTRPGEPTRTKAIIYVKGGKKGIVINKTNASMLAAAFGKNFAAWPNRKITIRSEPTRFGGKLTTGLRLYPVTNSDDRSESGPPVELESLPQNSSPENEMPNEIP